MENILIECKEKTSYPVSENSGDYKSVFKKPYFVYEGDEVAISKVFIDNKTSSDGVIVINNDLNINGNICLYTTNNNVAKAVAYTGQAINDNNDFFFSRRVDVTHPSYSNMIKIDSFYVYANSSSKPWGDPTGRRPLYVTYLDILGNKRTVFINVPYNKDLELGVDPFTKININPIIIQTGSLKVDNRNGNYEFNDIDPSISEDTPNPPSQGLTGIAVAEKEDNTSFNTDVLQPVNFPFEFSIEKGNYLPQDLATLINDKLTINKADNNFSAGNQVESPFFKTYLQASEGVAVPIMVSGANKIPNTFTMNAQNWLGANLIELQFDTSDNKFYWNFLHQPYYDTQTGNIATQILPRQIAGGLINARKNGGFCFTSWDTTETIINPIDGSRIDREFNFLEDVLKFNTSTLFATETVVMDFTSGASLFHANVITYNEGITSTNAKNTLDDVVEKSNFIVCPTTNFDPVESSLNTVIKAQEPAVSGEILDSGYYLVKCDCGFTNTLVSSDKITQNINSIVSRYYSLGSYTATELDPGMIYTHRGEPIMLTEANITILDSDRNIANVGDDNSIFITIVRGEFYKRMILD